MEGVGAGGRPGLCGWPRAVPAFVIVLTVRSSRLGERREAGMIMRRGWVLAVTLAAAASTMALGQTPTPAGNGTPSGAAIPDFGGVWRHPSLPGFEPPASGPGPVTNRSRRRDGRSNW